MALSFDQVHAAGNGRWKDFIFPAFGIQVPTTKSKHGACPICGGKDRFRCDDKQGKGTWICNQCGAGDGFSLIEKARGWQRSETLKEVAAILGIDGNSNVTDADRKKWQEQALQRQQRAEREELQAKENAAKRAERLWKQKSVDRDCPYLERKQVKNYGCLINGKGNLLVPLFDRFGKLWNIQEIHADGFKPYLSGGRVNGCFHTMGQLENSYDYICIAEGYATAASIHEATGYVTIVAFQANNLPNVAAELIQLYPDASYIWCADDDSAKESTGEKYANEAVSITGGIVVLPDFTKVIHHE